MVSEAQLRAQAKYDKQNSQAFMLKLNRKTDADIIAKINHVPNRQGYIKNLIRNDLRSSGSVLSCEAIQYLILPSVKKYNLSSVILFGSYARGDAGPESDVDLIIDGGNYIGLLGYLDVKEDLEKSLGKKVDLIEQSALQKNAEYNSETFLRNLKRDMVILYD